MRPTLVSIGGKIGLAERGDGDEADGKDSCRICEVFTWLLLLLLVRTRLPSELRCIFALSASITIS